MSTQENEYLGDSEPKQFHLLGKGLIRLEFCNLGKYHKHSIEDLWIKH